MKNNNKKLNRNLWTGMIYVPAFFAVYFSWPVLFFVININ